MTDGPRDDDATRAGTAADAHAPAADADTRSADAAERREDRPAGEGAGDASEAPGRGPWAAVGRTVRRVRDLNDDARLVGAARRLRDRLPGDSRFGDSLSTAPAPGRQPATERLAKLAGHPSGVSHEFGLGALQLFQAAAENRNRGRGQTDLAILFTDLVGFSSWAMDAGDDETLALLREVSDVLAPAVTSQRGEVVKWLGDGMMAVFRRPGDAVEAVARAQRGLEGVERSGHRPRIRAGIHVGRPKRVGRDYLGVDVNIAARVADAAAAGELYASDSALAGLGDDVRSRRKKRFRAKGVPAEIGVHVLLVD